MLPSSKILILGCGGMLGRHVGLVLGQHSPATRVVVLSRDRFHTPSEAQAYVLRERPTAAVNCIGYLGNTESLHYLVNGCIPRAIADSCERVGALCILISTDAVFRPDSGRKWLPADLPQPKTPYEEAKSFGEDRRAYIIRASFIGRSPKGVGTYDRLRKNRPFLERRWNGVTALTLAKRIARIIESHDACPTARLEHLHSPQVCSISKLARMLGSSSKPSGEGADRLLGGGVAVPSLRQQLEEYEAFASEFRIPLVAP